MRSDGQPVRDGREDDERANEVGEGGLAAELDRAEARAEGRGEHRGGHRTAELFVHLREEGREGCRVVAGECPPDSSDLEVC